MSQSDSADKSAKDTSSATPDKIEVKSDTFKKLTDEDLKDVSGGMMRSGKLAGQTTLNPTSTDGCCGG